MTDVVIAATGLYTPPFSVSNEELVAAYNTYVENMNAENAAAIEAGDIKALSPSSVEFVEKASGIKSRYVVSKEGIIDPAVMHPTMPERPNEQISVLAEIAVFAGKQALETAGRETSEVDAVLVACSNMQRAYPAMAIEVQDALGIEGFGFDMNVACSSATFGIQTAADFVRAGHARSVLVCNPEICTGHLNFRDRDSHFIFGDVATAILVERGDISSNGDSWEIVSTKLKTQFSNNIRNNFGFLNRTAPGSRDMADKLFVQEGRKVFKEVVPMVANMILGHLDEIGHVPPDVARFWLHQANANMNRLIAEKVLGREASAIENPTVLDEYANTSSAGSIIAFHKHRADLDVGALGLVCSFGAGYSAGTVFVRRVQ